MIKAKNDLGQEIKGKVEKIEKDLQVEEKNEKKVKRGNLKRKEARAETKKGIDQRTNLIKGKRMIETKIKIKIKTDKKTKIEKINPKSKAKTNDTFKKH